MTVVALPATSIPSDSRRVCLLGAVAALLIALGYLVIIPLYARVGAPPGNGEAWFSYLPGKTTAWWIILYLSVATDVLFLPIALALCLATKEVARYTMLLAAALMSLFVVLDLAVTWTHYASILTLFGNYAATVDPVRRAAYVAAVDYASAALQSRLEVVYAIVTLSSGIFLSAVAMGKARFGGITVALGLVTGLLGWLSLTGFAAAIIGNALAATVWLFFVAYGLFRRSRASFAS